jgi:nitroreductase
MADDTLVRSVVTAATRAPSVHNTQPWRFVAHGDVVELWADPARGLPVVDPDGRARVLSCGAALVLARVAAAALGTATSVAVVPDHAEPDHLADLHLDGPQAADDEARALAAAIDVRHTERGAFDDSSPVPRELVRALAESVRAEGCWLRVVDSTDDAAAVTVLLARADDLQSADPAYLEELRQWTGRDDDSPDGLPGSALPAAAPADRGSSYRLRDFDADRAERDAQRSEIPPRPEHPLVVVLGTDDDDAAAWLAAGQALGRLLLTATANGLVASPMTQALELTDTRDRLTTELGLVGHPQMVLRVGRAAEGSTTTGGATNRRPVDDVLEVR